MESEGPMRRRRPTVLAVIVLIAAACGGGDDEDDTAPEPDEPAGTPTVPAGDDRWTALTDAPTGLTEVGAAAFGGELWTAGGLTEAGEVTTAVQVFDPAAGDWRAGPELPEPVHHASLVATDRQLVLVGGYRSLAFDPVVDVLVLDDDGGAWVEGPSLPTRLGAGVAAWDGERLLYAGGTDGSGAVDDIWALDAVEGGEWTEAGRLSVAREHLGATSDGDGTVWFLGGREGGLDTNLATVDVVAGDEVTPTTDLPTARGGVAAFFSPEHGACLAGGEAPEGTFAEVECVDADGATTSLPSLSAARHGLGAAVIDGVAHVALGGPEPGLSVSPTVEALTVGTTG